VLLKSWDSLGCRVAAVILDWLETLGELVVWCIEVGGTDVIVELPDDGMPVSLGRGETDVLGMQVGVGWPNGLGEPTPREALPARTWPLSTP
jgi:hypothetical protein